MLASSVTYRGCRVFPCSLLTLQCPHLGARKPSGTVGKWLMRGVTHTALYVGNGHTGDDLALCTPVLGLLARAAAGLCIFRQLTCVALTHNDLLVTLPSASITARHVYLTPPSLSQTLTLVGAEGFSDPLQLMLEMQGVSLETGTTGRERLEHVLAMQEETDAKSNRLRMAIRQVLMIWPLSIFLITLITLITLI